MGATADSFDLRPGQPADVPACVDIIRAWGAETPWMAPLDDRAPMIAFWTEVFQIEQAWVAEQDGTIVGFCTRDADNIGGLYVATARRSTGIGKRLLDAAKAERDWITVWAYALNSRARDFYRREGLVEISREVEPESGLMNVEHRWVRER